MTYCTTLHILIAVVRLDAVVYSAIPAKRKAPDIQKHEASVGNMNGTLWSSLKYRCDSWCWLVLIRYSQTWYCNCNLLALLTSYSCNQFRPLSAHDKVTMETSWTLPQDQGLGKILEIVYVCLRLSFGNKFGSAEKMLPSLQIGYTYPYPWLNQLVRKRKCSHSGCSTEFRADPDSAVQT